MDYKSIIREVIDYPKPGIVFYDLTTLWNHPEALKCSIQELCQPYKETKIDKIVGAESRGFIIGAPMAVELGCGFVPARKKGKLPHETVFEIFDLEYGQDEIHMHRDSIQQGDKVLIVDDLIATGGTVSALIKIIERLGGEVVGACFLVELTFLKGIKTLDIPVFSLIKY